MPSLHIALALATVLPLVAAINDPVRVEQGQLSGISGASPGVRVYKGIPYAAPPVGDLRWRAPKPAADWPGVRKAADFSADCMQVPYPEGSIYRSEPHPVGEDCLYLNIWTTAKASDKRPVMVWIHGGAFTRGAGSTATYNGEALAKKGVVLVTINYRLGIFGFFAHPELTQESEHHSSGNYGILDQIAALQWVQKNIAAFGGDPKRVTIFGESAGSWAVNVLVASPLTKGLFQRAIGESGGNFGRMAKLANLEKSGLRVGASIKDLRAGSAEDILKATGSFSAVNVDGYVLPTDIMDIFDKGQQNDVPVLIGSNANEGTAFMPPKITLAGFQGNLKQRFGANASEFLKIYPATDDAEAWTASADIMRDQTFGVQMRTWARLQTKTGKSPAYLYYFSHVPPGPASAHYGAYHASEIAYVFGTGRNWQDDDRKLSGVMSSYWVNFATKGNPNGKGLPAWPAYDEKKDLALGLNDKIEPIPVPHKAALDVMSEILRVR